MNNRYFSILSGTLLYALLASVSTQVLAKPTCEKAIADVNNFLKEKGTATVQNVDELATTLRYLNKTGMLPLNYISHQRAKDLGWSGNDSDSLWGLNRPNGKYIGGDIYTGPKLNESYDWRSADIDSIRGYRGEKRLLYTNNSNQIKYITPDNNRHFVALSACE